MRVPYLSGLILLLAQTGWATYSIAACDAATRQCGVAVQTNNLAVGASVPFAQAGAGAGVSQFETNPSHGPQALALLASGVAPASVLKQILAHDSFDGDGPEARQVALVNSAGSAAAFTGESARKAHWAGSFQGQGYSVQGNGLVGERVLRSMEHAFLETKGPLTARLLAALIAGDAAGGQSTGKESAAILVRTPQGFPFDIDLRVDHSADPVRELGLLVHLHQARQKLADAERLQSRQLMVEAVGEAPEWPRQLLRAAKLAMRLGERRLAVEYLEKALPLNPVWVKAEVRAGTYAGLQSDPAFQKFAASVMGKGTN